MAREITLRTAPVKVQGLGALLGLTFITAGIYMLFWYYRINKEMKDFGTAYGDAGLAASNPGSSVLAMFIPIANLITLHNTAGRIRQAQAVAGAPVTYSVGLHWLIALFTGLWPLYAQSALNGLWEFAERNAQAGATETVAPPTAIAS